jgi:hypothetical protein
MDNKSTRKNKDDIYLKVWEMDKAYMQTRWTITTFFMSVSFAILGFSFKSDEALVPLIVQHIAALAIYWFAYFLNLTFYDYTNFLRTYLLEMEQSKQTTSDLESKTMDFMKKQGRPSTTQLLLYFGILYTVGVIIIWVLYPQP